MSKPKVDPRLIVDETKCFICQEKSPDNLVTRGKESFRLCEDCTKAVEAENKIRNGIKKAFIRIILIEEYLNTH